MSVASLRTALGNLSITGVTRSYTNKPLDLSSADLPTQWVGPITQDVEQITFTVKEPVYKATLNVATQAVVKGDRAGNETLADVDALQSALTTALTTPGAVTGFDIREYDIQPDVISVHGKDYDGLVITITAR